MFFFHGSLLKKICQRGCEIKLLAIPFRSPNSALFVLVWADLFGFVHQDWDGPSDGRLFVGPQHRCEV